eukprot:gene15308-biopygen6661
MGRKGVHLACLCSPVPPPPPPARARRRRWEGGRRKARRRASRDDRGEQKTGADDEVRFPNGGRSLWAAAAGGKGGWVARCAGVEIFGIFLGRIPARKSAPRAARPPPPAARPGRAEGADGTEGWSSFPTTVSGHRPAPSWRPVGGNGVQARGFKRNACFQAFDRGITYKIRVLAVSQFRILSRVGARDLGIPAFAPRSGPHPARAPGAQMIRMVSAYRPNRNKG